MPRTIIRLTQEDKEWLVQRARVEQVEVLTSFQAHREASAKQLLDRFPTHPAGADDADLAAAFRRQYRWKLPDALQAAIAVNRRLKLVTRNPISCAAEVL